MYIITSGLNPNEDHIQHYGRKGMRWGEHIFGMKELRAKGNWYNTIHPTRRPSDGSLTDYGKLKKFQSVYNSPVKQAIHTVGARIALKQDAKRQAHKMTEYHKASRKAYESGDKEGAMRNLEYAQERKEWLKADLDYHNKVVNKTVKAGKDFITDYVFSENGRGLPMLQVYDKSNLPKEYQDKISEGKKYIKIISSLDANTFQMMNMQQMQMFNQAQQMHNQMNMTAMRMHGMM